MQDKIKAALSQLDPENSDHWTSDGAPRVDVVAKLSGLEELTRKEITHAAPEFMRGSKLEAAEEEPETASEPASEDQTDPDELEAKQSLTAAKDELQDAQAALQDAQKRFDKAQRRHDEAITHLHRVAPNSTNGRAIKDYVQRSNEERLRRAERTQSILQGLDRRVLEAKAPIDAAMARRKTRGAERPNRLRSV